MQLYNPTIYPRPFWKIGITKFQTADLRLRYILESNKGFCWEKSKILQTFQHHNMKFIEEAEKILLAQYPKEIYFTEKFSGITECFALKNQKELDELVEKFTKIRYHFIQKRIDRECNS